LLTIYYVDATVKTAKISRFLGRQIVLRKLKLPFKLKGNRMGRGQFKFCDLMRAPPAAARIVWLAQTGPGTTLPA
jgi:hypothetical protein